MSPVRPTVQVVGRRIDPQDHRLRDFLTRIAQPHEWIDAGSPEAVRLLARLDLGDAALPIVIDGQSVHARATVESLAAAWRHLDVPKRERYDLAVIGAGPAGLAGDLGEEVSKLKAAVDGNIVVHGSGRLVRALRSACGS
jgi:thioredoxin reductase (NADPH)